jgi:hypothetical protein
MQSAIMQANQAEWKKVPQSESSRVDQALRQRGSDLQTAIRQGITPSDARVADVRAVCRNQFAQQPSQALRADAQTSKYVVDGLALGGQVGFNSAAYREYRCGPSDQFKGFTWCQKKRVETEARGQFTSSYSILHSADGAAFYVNRSLEPALSPVNLNNVAEIESEVAAFAGSANGGLISTASALSLVHRERSSAVRNSIHLGTVLTASV